MTLDIKKIAGRVNYQTVGHCSAFSLLEVILAITFLTVGAISILGVVVAMLSTVTSARNNVIAAQLTQEGVEIVRSMRDSHWLVGAAWQQGFTGASGCGSSTCVWRVQWSANSLLPLSTNPLLLYNGSSGYNYNSGTPTIFRRTVTISDISVDQIQVIVDVVWTERAQNRNVRVEDRLFNWF